MASSLLFSAARRCLVRPRQQLVVACFNNFQCSAPMQMRVKDGELLSQECEERTKAVLLEARNLKKLYTPPKFSKNISEIFNFFPLSPKIVENTLLDYPEILNHDASRAIEYIQVLVECGDFDIITQEEALMFVSRIPEILKINKLKFSEQVSDLFGLTANYDIPWNKVMIASPQTLTLNPQHVSHVVELLTQFFSHDRIRDVIGNNPEVLELIWYDIEAKIKYLQNKMHVSAYRIAMTPKSLTHDLEFLQLRYQFLSRSGHYRHPDAGARSAIPVEASPALHLITDTDDERFVHKCCPGLSMEEFNIFKSLMLLENEAEVDDEYDEVLDYNDDDRDNNSYTRTLLTNKNRSKNSKRIALAKT